MYKTEFLVVYDYGMGGIWAKIAARSATEIRERYPELKVYPPGERPAWMTADQEESYTENMHLDIDVPIEWLTDEGDGA